MPANVNADGSAKQLACPRCDACPTMEARLVGDTLMDECPACHGIWLDAAAVDRLVRERRQVSTDAVLGMGGPAARQMNSLHPPGRVYVKCPECDTIMNRTNFAKRSGIIIDTCRGHGTWFDADELPRIVEYVMNGGIEAANERRIDEGRREVRKEKAKARAMMAQAQKTNVRFRGQSDSVSVISGFLGTIATALLD